MFQSFNYIERNDSSGYYWQFKLVDSNFEELGTEIDSSTNIEVGVCVAVIDTYEKRNLPVVNNLIAAIIFVSKRWGLPINRTIENNKIQNPKFAKYEEELNKYLSLI
jgi:hypothetical protein